MTSRRPTSVPETPCSIPSSRMASNFAPTTMWSDRKDVTTAGLARMNMILHDFPTANIRSGNTLFDPKFKDGEQLRTYDYVVRSEGRDHRRSRPHEHDPA